MNHVINNIDTQIELLIKQKTQTNKEIEKLLNSLVRGVVYFKDEIVKLEGTTIICLKAKGLSTLYDHTNSEIRRLDEVIKEVNQKIIFLESLKFKEH